MEVVEDKRYSADYLDPGKPSIANAVQVFFGNGTKTEKVEVEYPIEHRRRRAEDISLLERRFWTNLRTCFSGERSEEIEALLLDRERLHSTPVPEFIVMLTV